MNKETKPICKVWQKFVIMQGTEPETPVIIESGTHGIFINNEHLSTTELLDLIEKRNRHRAF